MRNAAALQTTLASLQQQAADKFDPARFQHIANLHSKADNATDNVAELLLNKVQTALASYQQDYQEALEKAQANVTAIIENQAEAKTTAQALLAAGELQELALLKEKLAQQTKPSPLAELNDYINQELANNTLVEQPKSLSDVLNQFEQTAIKRHQRVPKKKKDSNELKAFNSFKQFKEKYDTDKLVEQMITERPDHLGPLNPQMLLLKSLESMRDLSPQYLSRFITYIDTLLKLEDAAKTTSMTKPKPSKK